ncbi:hypothetical protein PsorP6_009953 [Peronosclerospora sorghi]|uniref:Uncharacterized protein n=1 Tax=Peronosclerospora sorghi TaxID=230839 RepID=A0ACC0VVR7_9STRA|nr:hypothetical protein PsorP6_009953 [Peronosclerospora sorghi]
MTRIRRALKPQERHEQETRERDGHGDFPVLRKTRHGGKQDARYEQALRVDGKEGPGQRATRSHVDAIFHQLGANAR